MIEKKSESFFLSFLCCFLLEFYSHFVRFTDCVFFIDLYVYLWLVFSYSSSSFVQLFFSLEKRNTRRAFRISALFVSTQAGRQTDRTKTMNNITYVYVRIEENKVEKRREKRTRRAHTRGSSFTFV